MDTDQPDFMATFRARLIGRTALVLEDEDTVRAHLVGALRAIGFARVDEVVTGEEAVARAARTPYDVLILDRMTASMDGLSALRAIRRYDPHRAVPALFLTALGSERSRLEGLAEGDDYLVKPVSDEELFARIAALLRRAERSPDRSEQVVAVGPLTVDRRSARAMLGGVPIELTPREFAVLALLADNAGVPVTRSMLWSRCWPNYNFEPSNFANTIDVQISRLRRKLGLAGAAAGIDTDGMVVAMRVQGIVLRAPCG